MSPGASHDNDSGSVNSIPESVAINAIVSDTLPKDALNVQISSNTLPQGADNQSESVNSIPESVAINATRTAEDNEQIEISNIESKKTDLMKTIIDEANTFINEIKPEIFNDAGVDMNFEDFKKNIDEYYVSSEYKNSYTIMKETILYCYELIESNFKNKYAKMIITTLPRMPYDVTHIANIQLYHNFYSFLSNFYKYVKAKDTGRQIINYIVNFNREVTRLEIQNLSKIQKLSLKIKSNAIIKLENVVTRKKRRKRYGVLSTSHRYDDLDIYEKKYKLLICAAFLLEKLPIPNIEIYHINAENNTLQTDAANLFDEINKGIPLYDENVNDLIISSSLIANIKIINTQLTPSYYMSEYMKDVIGKELNDVKKKIGINDIVQDTKLPSWIILKINQISKYLLKKNEKHIDEVISLVNKAMENKDVIELIYAEYSLNELKNKISIKNIPNPDNDTKNVNMNRKKRTFKYKFPISYDMIYILRNMFVGVSNTILIAIYVAITIKTCGLFLLLYQDKLAIIGKPIY